MRQWRVAYESVEVDRHANLREQFPSPLALLLDRDDAQPRGLLSQKNIFTNGQRRDQVEFLIDDADASRLGSLRAVHRNGLAINLNRAFVQRVSSAKNAYQCALSSSVFTKQSVDLTGTQIKIDAAQRMHAGERFIDSPHRQERLRIVCRVSHGSSI